MKKVFCLETFIDSHWLDRVDPSDNGKAVVRNPRPTLESYWFSDAYKNAGSAVGLHVLPGSIDVGLFD